MKVVIDTNVFVNAIIGPQGPGREVIRLALSKVVRPQFSAALFTEYEDVCNRPDIVRKSALSRGEIDELINAVLSVSEFVKIYFGWRPNLIDEGDNHLLELAVASNATLITSNTRDLMAGQLRFPSVSIFTPAEFLTRRREKSWPH